MLTSELLVLLLLQLNAQTKRPAQNGRNTQTKNINEIDAWPNKMMYYILYFNLLVFLINILNKFSQREKVLSKQH